MSAFERGFQGALADMREGGQSSQGSSQKKQTSSRNGRQKPRSSRHERGTEAALSELESESDKASGAISETGVSESGSDKPSENKPSEEIPKRATPELELDKAGSERASLELQKSATPEPKSGASQMENSQRPQPKSKPEGTKEELLRGPRMIAVEIHPPSESNLQEYEFLPGHFDVGYVIDETEELEPEPFYRVKLRSGEVQKACFSSTWFCRLLALP